MQALDAFQGGHRQSGSAAWRHRGVDGLPAERAPEPQPAAPIRAQQPHPLGGLQRQVDRVRVPATHLDQHLEVELAAEDRRRLDHPNRRGARGLQPLRNPGGVARRYPRRRSRIEPQPGQLSVPADQARGHDRHRASIAARTRSRSAYVWVTESRTSAPPAAS